MIQNGRVLSRSSSCGGPLFAAGTEGLSPQDRGMDGGCTHCPAPGEGGVSERLLLCRETTWSRAGGGDQGGRHQAEV